MNKNILTYLGISLTLASCTDKPVNTETAPNPTGQIESALKNNKRSRELWRKQLEDLAKAPTPTELQMGAMCYMMMMPYADSYDCEKCKEKTLFAEGSREGRKAGRLKEISAQAAELRNIGLEVTLDSSCLCNNCSTGDEFYWEISNNGETIRTKYDSYDFYILRDFLKKKKIATGMTERQTPLKNYIPRLKELLLAQLSPVAFVTPWY